VSWQNRIAAQTFKENKKLEKFINGELFQRVKTLIYEGKPLNYPTTPPGLYNR